MRMHIYINIYIYIYIYISHVWGLETDSEMQMPKYGREYEGKKRK